MILIIITALVWAALGWPVEAPAQDGDLLLQLQPKKYTAYRSIGSVNIDGRLDEPSWQCANIGAAMSSNFCFISHAAQGNTYKLPSHSTSNRFSQ